jgi:hypothetical protein
MRIWMIILFLPALLTVQGCSSIDGAHTVSQEKGSETSVRKMTTAMPAGPIDCNWKNLLPVYRFYSLGTKEKDPKRVYDPSSTYVVRVPVYFAEYDPEAASFPLKSRIKGGTDISVVNKVVSVKLGDTLEPLAVDVQAYPKRFRVSFSADAKTSLPLSAIPMAADEAKGIMQSKQTRSGYNRQAFAKIEFVIRGLKSGQEKNHFIGMIKDIRYEL